MGSQNGTVVLFTGLSGSGKSTLAQIVARRLRAGGWTAEVVDGDDLRRQLSAGLGFSRRDREENIRRASCLAQCLAPHVDFVLLAMIAPYRASRAAIAARFPTYIEIFVNAPLSVCEARDPKGFYGRARAGHISHFTGLDDPYEPPLRPALECRTDRESTEQSALKVFRHLTRAPGPTLNSVDAVRNAVDTQPGITMAELATRLGITTRALSDRLRKENSQTYRGLRGERLLGRAQEMLRRNCRVKEVALVLGFRSTQSFDRFYRRACGRSPTDFRNG